jgi:diguanylate cyclase (GGDEF)-like protein
MSARGNSDIPEDVYVQFVRSLFDNRYMLVVGAVCHASVALLSFWRSGEEPIYAVMAVVLLAVGLWRFADLARFRRIQPELDRKSAEKWERSYLIKGSIQGCLLGTFCFISIYLRPNAFAEMGALAVTLGSIVTVVGRNYGSPRMVGIFATTFVGPIAIGLILRFELAYVVLGLLIVPFFFIIKSSADNVRQVLFSAVIGHKRARQLAQRFDRALNTMPHGLVMFDSDGHAIVANAQAAELLNFASSRHLLRRSLKGLLLRGVASGLLTRDDSTYAEVQLTRALREGRDRKLLLKLTDNRYLEFSAGEGRDEIGVITFEEVTQRVEAEEKIRFMARHDTLTGLANRADFHELVGEALQTGDPDRLCGLVVFDLDDFKSINDTLGHPVGDGLLFAVADKLSSFADENITVSRFGGDEFMVFVNDAVEEGRFRRLIQNMFANMEGDIDVAGHALRVQLSAGAVLCKVSAADVDGMVVKADLALYKTKELGKNGWQLFETAMDEAFRNRQLLKADLRSAIESRNLRIVYQPIVSVDTMRISSCEALCRWDHPELGPVSPAIFIPLAEETGIVSDISSLVLEAACTQCVKWPEHISVSVNLSAKDFRSRDVVERVAEALRCSGLAPHRLEIEVTETALLDDKASTRSYIEDMKALGVRIALDDFGTGYSSLSYLHTLPLDKVKIDGSFLTDITRNNRSMELLTGVVDLSRRLGLTVTVEGVETFEQFKLLAGAARPDLVQGFLFGSALTASGIETMAGQVWPFPASADEGPSKAKVSAGK